jgi:dihydroneopterin aldolase/2-amino-4-hydroxy-6-hydroxymethyldihydropteridine diphosphokinase
MDGGGTVTVYLGVGSNIDPEQNVPRALELLRRAVTVTGVSTFYQTLPLGRPERAPFYNGAVRCQTNAPLPELRRGVLRGIEAQLGRVRTADKHAARPIDLDVLLYGDEVVCDESGRVPDPDIEVRPFLAVPLLELAPDLVLPDSGKPLQTLVASMDPTDMTPLPEFSERLRNWRS